ncbi:MAG: metallophosphoesterase [Burkholderiales bacterium]
MRTLVHLSDLHFGRVDPPLLVPLARAVREARPHVVVVSGDLTQRAKSAEFRDARRFLDTLPEPLIVVPGNHDVPLYNLVQRFLQPLAKYRRYISRDVEPAFVDDEIAVVGVNTARSASFKGGRINKAQIARVRERLAGLDRRITKIVVTHHPFDLSSEHDVRAIVGRAHLAMQAFAACGADILLAGHLHTSRIGDTAARYPIERFAALVVQAGTATSVRARGEANSFNVLRLEPHAATIERFAWNGADFTRTAADTFERAGDGWRRRLSP